MTLTLRKAHNVSSLTRPAQSSLLTTSVATTSSGPVLQATRHIGAGYAFGIGSQYTEVSPLIIPANTPTKVMLPDISIDDLRGAFKGHDFISSGDFQPRGVGDTTILRISMIGKADLSNTQADLSLRLVGSEIDAEEEGFSTSAGTPSRLNFKFLNFSAQTFVANGGEFFITTTADAEVWDVRPLIVPISPQ